MCVVCAVRAVCVVCGGSYAEVRAERRRAMGLEEMSPVELAPSSVKVGTCEP